MYVNFSIFVKTDFSGIYIAMKRKNIELGKEIILGKGVKLEDNIKLLGNTKIGDGCVIKSGSVLQDVVVGKDCVIDSSLIKESNIGDDCKIGPFAHIRPNCILGCNVKVGAFVEIKNSYIGKGTKVPHLSYVGDADIGENVNIGCGVVFANYDGKQKRRSKIGNNVFIGCNVNIVAPVDIADNSYICAGTTVTKDTKKGDFVIGRVRQENKQREK